MRGNTQAQEGAQAGLNLSGTNAGEAAGIFGPLASTLTTQMIHPPGMNPTDYAAMNTEAQQGAGGSAAAAVGQGALRAARTRNVGGANASEAASNRQAGEQLSKGRLATQLANQKLKQEQQTGAERGLGSLFGETTSAANQGLGETAANVNANTGAVNATTNWDKFLFGPLISAASSGAGAAGGP